MIRRVLITSFLSAVVFTAGASFALGQAQLGSPVVPPMTAEAPPISGAAPSTLDLSAPSRFRIAAWPDTSTGFLVGNRDFQNFIGFISNPVQSIDPRSTTEIVAMFGGAWASPNDATLPNGKTVDRGFLPSGNMQVYGGGPMAIAITDRLCIGLNDGGYAVANFNSDQQRILAKLGLPVPNRDLGGQREGWLNLGGYVQYTIIADVPNQFILTGGLRWEAPMGATQIFQGGANPAYLAPYVTIGKEFGNYHVLATTGYEFAAGDGVATSSTFYLNLHLDRKIGWFYPLVEFNGAYHTSTVNLNSLSEPLHDVFSLGTVQTTSNALELAVGANAVLIPNKLELGAVYIRPIASQDRFDFNGMLVKMVWRY
jgi:hypothetical protein